MNSISINSTISIPGTADHNIVSRNGFLMNIWMRTPVYLVNPNLMDTLYPPEMRRILSEECTRKALDAERRVSEDQRGKDTELAKNENRKLTFDQRVRFWRRLNECVCESSGLFFAMGVFKKSLTLSELDAIHAANPGILLARVPSVFVCPERVDDWTNGVTGDFAKIRRSMISELLYSTVVCHELVHAFISSDWGRYTTPWGRFVEESLANAIACSRFEGRNRAIVNYAVALQPLEYRSCSFWYDFSRPHLRVLARGWGDDDVDPFLDLDHFGILPYHFRSAHMPPNISRASHDEWIWKTIAELLLEEALGGR